MALYFPLYYWRRWQDSRSAGRVAATVTVAALAEEEA
jgi:hypothetical protein